MAEKSTILFSFGPYFFLDAIFHFDPGLFLLGFKALNALIQIGMRSKQLDEARLIVDF